MRANILAGGESRLEMQFGSGTVFVHKLTKVKPITTAVISILILSYMLQQKSTNLSDHYIAKKHWCSITVEINLYHT